MDSCIFISHSHRDQPVAKAICAALESRGQHCWLAKRDNLPGSDWIDGIIGAIKRSLLVILVYTPAADRSPEVRDEYERARELGLPIIVFRIVDFEASERVRHRLGFYHWLDAWDGPEEQRIARLCAAVESALDKRRRESLSTPPPVSIDTSSRQWQRHDIETSLRQEYGTPEAWPPHSPVRQRDGTSAAVRNRVDWRSPLLAFLLLAAAALLWLRIGMDRDGAQPAPLAPRMQQSPVPAPAQLVNPTPDEKRVVAPAALETTQSAQRRAPPVSAAAETAAEPVAPSLRVSADEPTAVAAPAPGTTDPAEPLRLLDSAAFADLLRDSDPLPDEVYSETWRTAPGDSDSLGYLRFLGNAQQALTEQGWPAAVEQFNAAAEAAQNSLREFPGDAQLRRDTAALLRLAGAYSATGLGALDHAAAQLANAATVAAQMGGQVPYSSTVLCHIRREQALLKRQQGSNALAAQLANDAAGLVEGLPFRDEVAAGANACLLLVKKTVASWAVDDGRLDRAAAALSESDGLVRVIAGGGSGNAWLDRQKLDLHRLRGRLAAARGDDATAMSTFDEATRFAQGLLDQTPGSTSLRIAFVDTVREAVRCRMTLTGHDGEALSLLTTWSIPAASELSNPRAASRGANELDLARLLRRLPRTADAKDALERARAIADARQGLGGLGPGYNRLALAVYAEMGRFALLEGNRVDAFAALNRARAIGAALERVNIDDAFVKSAAMAVDEALRHLAEPAAASAPSG